MNDTPNQQQKDKFRIFFSPQHKQKQQQEAGENAAFLKYKLPDGQTVEATFAINITNTELEKVTQQYLELYQDAQKLSDEATVAGM